jgi:hypothetical protein
MSAPNPSGLAVPGQGQSRRGARFIGSGAVLLAISFFLPWVQVVLLGSVTFIQLANLSNHESLAWGGLALALALALWAFGSSQTGGLLRIAALIVACYVGLNAVDFIRQINKADGLASVEIGAYAAIASGILMFIGAITSSHAATSSNAPQSGAAPSSLASVSPAPSPLPGWYVDPSQPSQLRWWAEQAGPTALTRSSATSLGMIRRRPRPGRCKWLPFPPNQASVRRMLHLTIVASTDQVLAPSGQGTVNVTATTVGGTSAKNSASRQLTTRFCSSRASSRL